MTQEEIEAEIARQAKIPQKRWTKAVMEKRLSRHERQEVSISANQWERFKLLMADYIDRKSIVWDATLWEDYYMWAIGYVPDRRDPIIRLRLT